MSRRKATQTAVAAHLDLSPGRVSVLMSDGVLPKGGSLDECRVAYIQWLRARLPHGAGNRDLNAGRARLAAAQAEKQEMEVLERRGELLPVDSVASLWARVVTDAKTALLALPSKLAPQVVGKSREEARARIDSGIRDALRRLAETAGDLAAGVEPTVKNDGKRVGRRKPAAKPRGERGARPLGH